MTIMKPKIHIPSPCSEDWSKMKIVHRARFCSSCTKNVMDFTQMSREEILTYLLENHNKNVSGHIHRSQLDFSTSDYLVTIERLAKTTKNTNLAFYLLAFSALVLAGCDTPSNAQTNPKDSISIVEMVQDTTQKQTTICPPKNVEEHNGNHKLLGKIAPKIEIEEEELEGEIYISPSQKKYDLTEDRVFNLGEVHKFPEYYGGIDRLKAYIKNNLIHPDPDYIGTTYVQFIVTTEGKLRDFKIIRSFGDAFDKEAIRLLSNMPLWKPGELEGEKVNVLFTLPIEFK